jgi:hypothetical protein
MSDASIIREELAADRVRRSRLIAEFEALQERYRILTEDPAGNAAGLRQLQRDLTAFRARGNEILNSINSLAPFLEALPPGPEKTALINESNEATRAFNSFNQNTFQPFRQAVDAEVARVDRELANAAVNFTQAPAPVANNVSAVWDPETGSWGIWNNDTQQFIRTGLTEQQAKLEEQELSTATEPGALQTSELEFFQFDEDGNPVPEATEQAAVKQATINQATLQSRYNQPGSTDWRVRLQLGPGSDYLYNATPPGVLAPLAATNGVLFPYVPQIITGYKSSYETYNLIHSNFRGVFYKNSQVDDVQIRGIFTAQDTREAEYLLAVIHFFRSVTKMFYGKDTERGTPPPLVYLSGFGDYQFAQHPCVVSQFTYQLPDNVDYIRATNPNNYGQNLLNRRTPVKASFGGGNFAGAIRLANALLGRGAEPEVPSPSSLDQSVSNTQKSTYVPTRMEIDITLIPLQSREQISKQFSLKGFANGDLIKGGYW